MRIPQVTGIETAIEIYYSTIEMKNADIRQLFGKISSSTIAKLKNVARAKMREKDVPTWNANYVNTAAAFEAWGLNIEDLERRAAKLSKLKRQMR